MMKDVFDPSSGTSPTVYEDWPESLDIQEAVEPLDLIDPDALPVPISPVDLWRRILIP